MDIEILVSRAHGETRVAVLENEVIQEVHVERDHRRGVVGKHLLRTRQPSSTGHAGGVRRSQGWKEPHFLYVDDVVLARRAVGGQTTTKAQNCSTTTKADPEAGSVIPEPVERPTIEQLLRDGQPVTVQVAKAPIGTKGARVTTYITLPGTVRRVHADHAPDRRVSEDHVPKPNESGSRSYWPKSDSPGEGGFIARTVCQGLDEARIRQDVEFLRSLWTEVLARKRSIRPSRAWSCPTSTSCFARPETSSTTTCKRMLHRRSQPKCRAGSPPPRSQCTAPRGSGRTVRRSGFIRRFRGVEPALCRRALPEGDSP